MREVIMENFGSLGVIVITGVIILTFFTVLSCFRTIFSSSFIGFLLSLVSYFVYEYIYMNIPVVASIAFILCLCGVPKKGIISTIFAIIGLLLSGYIIITTLGII